MGCDFSIEVKTPENHIGKVINNQLSSSKEHFLMQYIHTIFGDDKIYGFDVPVGSDSLLYFTGNQTRLWFCTNYLTVIKYTVTAKLLATVSDGQCSWESRLKPKYCQIGIQGCQYTWTVNSDSVGSKSSNPSELGRLSASRSACPFVDTYKAPDFCCLIIVPSQNPILNSQ